MINLKRFESLEVIARVSCTIRGVMCIHNEGGTMCCCARVATCASSFTGCTGRTLDVVYSGKELAADVCVATGKNTASGD